MVEIEARRFRAYAQARKVLEKIRGTADVDEEYADVLEKAQLAAQIKNPWTLLLFHKKCRCYTVIAVWGAALGWAPSSLPNSSR